MIHGYKNDKEGSVAANNRNRNEFFFHIITPLSHSGSFYYPIQCINIVILNFIKQQEKEKESNYIGRWAWYN
ncbi:hypothetical protein Bamy01_29720 [Bacillus amyloliquefaciens]|nr:hypothetical protein Bamy01_29720 [Bacillus amyloliquefaciens]